MKLGQILLRHLSASQCRSNPLTGSAHTLYAKLLHTSKHQICLTNVQRCRETSWFCPELDRQTLSTDSCFWVWPSVYLSTCNDLEPSCAGRSSRFLRLSCCTVTYTQPCFYIALWNKNVKPLNNVDAREFIIKHFKCATGSSVCVSEMRNTAHDIKNPVDFSTL